MQLTDSQWLLDVMGRHDFTIPSVAFDEIINRIELLSSSKPAAPTECGHRLVDARNEVVQSGYLCTDCGAVFAGIHSAAAPAQSAEPIYQIRASRYVSDWTDVSADDARFHDYPPEHRRIVHAAPQPSPTAVVLDNECAEFELLSKIDDTWGPLSDNEIISHYANTTGHEVRKVLSIAQPVEQTRALPVAGETWFARIRDAGALATFEVIEVSAGTVLVKSPGSYYENRYEIGDLKFVERVTAARPASGETE